MEREGITVVQTKVGDRYVLEAMKARGYTLGGEQSGHVILSDHATTGDGILTALQVLARMAETGRSLADLAGVMTRLPQILVNVPGRRQGPRRPATPTVPQPCAEAEAELARARAGAAAALGHGAAGPRDGRGREPGAGRRGRAPAGRPGEETPRALSDAAP